MITDGWEAYVAGHPGAAGNPSKEQAFRAGVAHGQAQAAVTSQAMAEPVRLQPRIPLDELGQLLEVSRATGGEVVLYNHNRKREGFTVQEADRAIEAYRKRMAFRNFDFVWRRYD